MAWNFRDDKPIFQQLVDIIATNIIRGNYHPGDKLEAVRDLALKAGVNPNTMQRALAEIETTGLIYSKRGDGRYVSEDKKVMEQARNRYVEKSLEEFITALSALGLTEKEILSCVEEKLNK